MKTWKLWILEYTAQTGRGELVPLYCADEKEAETKAAKWCLDHSVLIGNARLNRFPGGFRIHHSELPGEIITNDEKQSGD